MADNHPALTGDSAPAEARGARKHPTKGLAKHLVTRRRWTVPRHWAELLLGAGVRVLRLASRRDSLALVC